MTNHKGYCLFLDDIREVSDVKSLDQSKNWIVARSYHEFVDTLSDLGLPEVVSFDHDLCDEHYMDPDCTRFRYIQDGSHAAHALVTYCKEMCLSLPEINIHTINPIGRRRIFEVLNKSGLF